MINPSGYSGTPLPKKLGIKPAASVLLVNAAPGCRKILVPLPEGVTFKRQARAPVDVIVFFTKTAAELKKRLPTLARALDPAGGLWIAWPKKSSGVATDLDFDAVQQAGLALGLVDNKVCAVDETWSGLRMVVRLKDRPPKKAMKKKRR